MSDKNCSTCGKWARESKTLKPMGFCSYWYYDNTTANKKTSANDTCEKWIEDKR